MTEFSLRRLRYSCPFGQFSHLGFRLVDRVVQHLLCQGVLSCLACIDDLSNLELALANNEDVITIRAFVADDLTPLAHLFIHTEVEGGHHTAWQVVQERNLSEEVLHLVYLAPVDVVKHLPIVLLAHHCKLAIHATQN